MSCLICFGHGRERLLELETALQHGLYTLYILWSPKKAIKADISIAQKFSNFLKCPFEIPVPLHGGPLSSSSYCLVPMSCETGSRPDYTFNNALWYMTSSVLMICHFGGNYDLNVLRSHSLTVFLLWYPWTCHYMDVSPSWAQKWQKKTCENQSPGSR